jgi:TonB family protein
MWWRLKGSLLCIVIAVRVVPAQAQNLQKELESALKNRILTLRNYSPSDKLSFDQQGSPKKKEGPGPWTLNAQFLVQDVGLSERLLRLKGPRIVNLYDSNQQKMVQQRSNENLQVEIDVNAGFTANDIPSTLASVFVTPQELSRHVPSYWSDFLEGNPRSGALTRGSQTAQSPITVSQLVQQSKLISQIRPQYPEAAKQYKLSGMVLFQAEIDEAGNVAALRILTPAGAGFDESAAEAVYRWKYSPTLVQGKPMRVITTITVNFTIAR